MWISKVGDFCHLGLEHLSVLHCAWHLVIVQWIYPDCVAKRICTFRKGRKITWKVEKILATWMYYGLNVDMWEYLDMFCFSTGFVLVSLAHKMPQRRIWHLYCSHQSIFLSLVDRLREIFQWRCEMITSLMRIYSFFLPLST